MSNHIVKLALIAILTTLVLSQVPQSDTLSQFSAQTCCPAGYNVAAGIYCVKCNQPKHWDALA